MCLFLACEDVVVTVLLREGVLTSELVVGLLQRTVL